MLSKAAAGFKVAAIVTTAAKKSFSGPMFPELTETFANGPIYDRTSMNAWEDTQIISQVNDIGNDWLVFAGLWMSACIVRHLALNAPVSDQRPATSDPQLLCMAADAGVDADGAHVDLAFPHGRVGTPRAG
ncbi:MULTISPECIES: isochorismatase family protein [Lysobacter]|uniref:isochorismatase family protein n=1 Tax=Lysobacter TaxID=68 RepID=UPI001F1E3D53|nr:MULTISPECIES: isochorismatase family protein [Lysobacter]UJB21438.1 isochorismatase family protein [Lysobacter capsici]UJQ29445.1 isochorismatase family protein [Lysobacter gummosus]